ncbi:MAG: hypothetical protein ABJH04_07680 [Cyclobacteriaceae bacterium]
MLTRQDFIDFVDEQVIPIVEEFAKGQLQQSIVITWHLSEYSGPLYNDKIGLPEPNVIRIFITRKGNRNGDVNYPQLQIACNSEGAISVWSTLKKNDRPQEIFRTFNPNVELTDSYLLGFLNNQLQDQTL